MRRHNIRRIAAVLIIITALMFTSIAMSFDSDEFKRSRGLKDCWHNSDCPWPSRCAGDGFCRNQCIKDRDCDAGWVCRIPTYEQVRAALASQSTSAPAAQFSTSGYAGEAIVYISGVGPGTPVEEVRIKFKDYAQCVPPPGWPNITPPPGGWPALPEKEVEMDSLCLCRNQT